MMDKDIIALAEDALGDQKKLNLLVEVSKSYTKQVDEIMKMLEMSRDYYDTEEYEANLRKALKFKESPLYAAALSER